MAMTHQIVAPCKKAYETQGRTGLAIFEIAQREVEKSLGFRRRCRSQRAAAD